MYHSVKRMFIHNLGKGRPQRLWTLEHIALHPMFWGLEEPLPSTLCSFIKTHLTNQIAVVLTQINDISKLSVRENVCNNSKKS